MVSGKMQESLFREFSYLSQGNWLGISLSVRGGDWLCLHHLSCFVFSLSFFVYFCFLNYFYHYPWVFWLLLFLSSSSVTVEARVGENKQAAVVQSCLLGWTHKNAKQNIFRKVSEGAIGSLSMLNPLDLFFLDHLAEHMLISRLWDKHGT